MHCYLSIKEHLHYTVKTENEPSRSEKCQTRELLIEKKMPVMLSSEKYFWSEVLRV